MVIHIHVQIHKEVKLAVWLSIFRSIIFNTALKKGFDDAIPVTKVTYT